ncbi:MAG: pilus assembly protein [bacterium]|nr:pilus assembly protein [bacterium]
MRRVVTRIGISKSRFAADESGVSMVFLAVSMVVLIGMVAFAVDVGALYQERRELQSGADAAAFAIAEDCALNALPCTQGQADSTADAYADANAGDAEAAIDNVDLDLANKIVEVDVSTETASGGTIFRPFFANVVGFEGTTVHAEAAVQWGFASGLATIPLIISKCEYDREVGGEYDYNPVTDLGLHGLNEPEGATPWQGASPKLLKFHTGSDPQPDCAAQAGQDTDGDGRLPGGFGWLADDDGLLDCKVHLETGNIAPGDPGASPTNGCSAAELKALIFEKTVNLPWFADTNDAGGANATYTIEDFVGFYVTGYNFGGQYKEPGSGPCHGSTRCLEGYFKYSQSDSGEIGGNSGVIIVKFIK